VSQSAGGCLAMNGFGIPAPGARTCSAHSLARPSRSESNHWRKIFLAIGRRSVSLRRRGEPIWRHDESGKAKRTYRIACMIFLTVVRPHRVARDLYSGLSWQQTDER
jgi:hypothetical protein